MENVNSPFEEIYLTPHGSIPFNKIKVCDYQPAISKGIKEQNQEIDDITSNPEAPTFENTIEALEKSGKLLSRVAAVLGNMLEAEADDQLQTVAQELIPQLTEHDNSIFLNEELFARVKAVHDKRENMQLDAEQKMLLHDTFDNFVRSGANLTGDDRKRYRELTSENSRLSLKFDENNLKEVNSYKLHITDKRQLKGLPENIVEAAAETAKEKELCGWVFTMHAPSYVPFLKYADDRNLREEIYKAYASRCAHNNETCNLEIVKKLVNNRLEIAHLLGYENYAQYVLADRMACDSEHVYKLLNQLLDAYTATARQEYDEVEQLAQDTEGSSFKLMPWDWAYYSNLLKKKKFNIQEEMLRPYFSLDNVKQGIFELAGKLYGIRFRKNDDIPVYHPDVEAYEVFDKNGMYLAILYTDFFPREGKQGGAWMTEFKGQWKEKESGENSRPHISLVMNFTKPTADKPALLTFDEVKTFLHEFGHSLHGILSDTTYESQSGTNVYRDFVELPSQFMENFAIEHDFLHTFAKHYLTAEELPDNLLDRLVQSNLFNVAYACLRQVSFGLLDMAWHSLTTPFNGDVRTFEHKSWQKAQLLPTNSESCMSTQFSHIFSGGYAAGYYGYKWAEVLDADAFSLFKEKGIFNKETAASFRENILSKGGTEHPMTLYKRFRGQEPTIDALLKRELKH